MPYKPDLAPFLSLECSFGLRKRTLIMTRAMVLSHLPNRQLLLR